MTSATKRQRNLALDNSPSSPPTQGSDFLFQTPPRRVISKHHLSPYSVDVIEKKHFHYVPQNTL
jgi:hypothetical protein